MGCLETKPLLMPVEIFTIGGLLTDMLCLDCRLGFEADEYCCLWSDIAHKSTDARRPEPTNEKP